MNMEDIMKENLEISVKNLEIISKRQLGVALDGFFVDRSETAYQ